MRPSGQKLPVSDKKEGGLYPGGAVGRGVPPGPGRRICPGAGSIVARRAKIRDRRVGLPGAWCTTPGLAVADTGELSDWLCNCSMTSPTTPQSTKPSAKSPAKTGVSSDVAASYEAALDELEQLVAQLDAGQLPLDQLLSRYQRGAELLAFCRTRLEAVDNQIKVLEGGEIKPWNAA